VKDHTLEGIPQVLAVKGCLRKKQLQEGSTIFQPCKLLNISMPFLLLSLPQPAALSPALLVPETLSSETAGF